MDAVNILYERIELCLGGGRAHFRTLQLVRQQQKALQVLDADSSVHLGGGFGPTRAGEQFQHLLVALAHIHHASALSSLTLVAIAIRSTRLSV